MAREKYQGMMQTVEQRPDYIGALIEDERRMLLVSVDPDQPWEAFRRLRRSLRKDPSRTKAMIDIFEAPSPLEHTADVIPLASRRRAG